MVKKAGLSGKIKKRSLCGGVTNRVGRYTQNLIMTFAGNDNNIIVTNFID